MATYSQWATAFSRKGPARVTWVCGPERVLVDDVASAVNDGCGELLEAEYRLAGAVPEAGIWDLVLTAPHKPWSRLVLVGRAEKLRQWEHLQAWMTERVPVWLVLKSGEDDFPRDDEGKLAEPASWIRDSSLGHIVRCSRLEDGDAVAWMQGKLPGLTVSQARKLLARASGDLSEVGTVLRKLRLFDGPFDDHVLELCSELPGEFADQLIAGNRRGAMHAAESMSEQELIRSIGLLASRLQVLSVLHRAHRDHMSMRDVITRLSVPSFLAQKYSGVARDYGEERIARSWLAVSAAEDAFRSGAEAGGVPLGIAEALVLSWLGSREHG